MEHSGNIYQLPARESKGARFQGRSESASYQHANFLTLAHSNS